MMFIPSPATRNFGNKFNVRKRMSSPLRDCVAMCCSVFDVCKSPLAPLFQRGVILWDREELELVVSNSPFFSKGDKGGFSEHLDGNRSWSLVE